MNAYSFRIRLHGPLDDMDADRLYDGVRDEVSVETGPRGNWVSFDREAQSFLEAVLSALQEILNLGFEPLMVEDELVSMSDIAERTRRTRQSVSMLVDGRRGGGDFPPPAAGNVRSPLWHWADVEAWFATEEQDATARPDRLSTITAINGALASRVLARERPDDLQRIREAIAG